MKKMFAVILILSFLAAACTTVVHPPRPGPAPCAGKAWVPGHHKPNGVWVPGHWRCP